ncbi:MAG: hypothetical protein AAF654_07510 [Myxococcota bacterium]
MDLQPLKDRINEISDILWSAASRDLSDEQRQALKREEKDLLLEYAELLDFKAVSRCPISNAPIEIAIDLAGLDSPWWWSELPVDLPPHRGSKHLQLVLGALNLGARDPSEATEQVTAGPAKPFLIDRLLGMPGVEAVLSEQRTQHNDRLFLICYFALEPIPQEELHQEFRKTKYGIFGADGEIQAAATKHDPWNFDLLPWAEQDKLKWIEPGDESLKLRTGPPVPFMKVSGTEKMQKIVDGSLELWPAPEGQDDAQFERS